MADLEKRAGTNNEWQFRIACIGIVLGAWGVQLVLSHRRGPIPVAPIRIYHGSAPTPAPGCVDDDAGESAASTDMPALAPGCYTTWELSLQPI